MSKHVLEKGKHGGDARLNLWRLLSALFHLITALRIVNLVLELPITALPSLMIVVIRFRDLLRLVVSRRIWNATVPYLALREEALVAETLIFVIEFVELSPTIDPVLALAPQQQLQLANLIPRRLGLDGVLRDILLAVVVHFH